MEKKSKPDEKTMLHRVVVAITLLAVAHAESCNDAFLAEVSAATGSFGKCGASFNYERCIDKAAADGTLAGNPLAAARTAMEQARSFLVASEKCSQVEALAQTGPKMAAFDGNMKFSVDSGKGVVFEEFRGTTVSLFDLVSEHLVGN